MQDNRRQRLLSISSDSSEDNNDNLLMGHFEPKYYNPKTKNQSIFIDALKSDYAQIVICHGSAGTGKTLLSCQEGIRSYLHKNIDKIIITRPAVCADEDIGYLPGDLEDKMKPFTQPLFDTFEKILPTTCVQYMVKTNHIQIIPLAYMRGRTFENKFIIADEMQNTTIEQMIMLLTRIGKGSKLVIVGDTNQCDRKVKCNGLLDLLHKMKNSEKELKRIKLIELENKDIQREECVKEAISLYNHM